MRLHITLFCFPLRNVLLWASVPFIPTRYDLPTIPQPQLQVQIYLCCPSLSSVVIKFGQCAVLHGCPFLFTPHREQCLPEKDGLKNVAVTSDYFLQPSSVQEGFPQQDL